MDESESNNAVGGAHGVLDALIIGAGFSGLYQLHRLRQRESAKNGYSGFELRRSAGH